MQSTADSSWQHTRAELGRGGDQGRIPHHKRRWTLGCWPWALRMKRLLKELNHGRLSYPKTQLAQTLEPFYLFVWTSPEHDPLYFPHTSGRPERSRCQPSIHHTHPGTSTFVDPNAPPVHHPRHSGVPDSDLRSPNPQSPALRVSEMLHRLRMILETVGAMGYCPVITWRPCSPT